MSQNSFQQIRQKFAKQKRRQHLEKIFKSKRAYQSQKITFNQNQTVSNLLPTINSQTYHSHKLILSDFARSTAYSYQMLPIAFISFEHLLACPFDACSWQILTYLSDYQDFQIPQTEDFANILLQYLNQDPQLISEFLLNISRLPKCSLLCCRLIDSSIFYILQQKIESIEKNYADQCLINKSDDFKGKENMELQIHNFLFALCELFSIQPMIEIYQMNKICEIMNIDNKFNRFLKQIHTEACFKLIENAVSGKLFFKKDFSHQPEVIKLVFDKFEPTVQNSFWIFPEESIRFLNSCIKNKVILSERLIQNVLMSIKVKSSKIKIDALNLMQKILDFRCENERMQVEPSKFQSIESLIDKKISISFEDFNSMFSRSKAEQKKTDFEEQVQNFLMLQSILFAQKYEQEIRILFEISESQGDKVKEQIAKLFKSMIKCLIREISSNEPKIMKKLQKKAIVPEEMEELMRLTVKQEGFFFWIESCLKSTNLSLVKNALETLMDVLVYFEESNSQFDELESQVSFSFVTDQVKKFGIHAILECMSVSQNNKISEMAGDLMQIMEEDTE